MPVLIRSSPKIREAKPSQPGKPNAAKPKFVVRSRVEPPRKSSGGATFILTVAFVLGLLGLGAHAIWSHIQGPDPHYLKAQQLVRDYEYGKPKQTRNYEHQNYREALAELALVDPDSKSAAPAQALRIEIERNITKFREQQERINRQFSAVRAKNRKRRNLEAQARMHGLMAPQTEFPECEFEEHGNEQNDHAH
jgi:hypothetical protein